MVLLQWHSSASRSIACSAKQVKRPKQKGSALRSLSKRWFQGGPQVKKHVPPPPKWQFLSAEAYLNAPKWDVPWGWQTIVLGMLLWAVSFVLTGFLALPIGAALLGASDTQHFTSIQQSQLQLFGQVLSTIFGVTIVRNIGSKSKDIPEDYLMVSFKDPFSPPNGWVAWSIFGIISAPAAVSMSALFVSLLPFEAAGGAGTVDAVANLVESIDTGVFVNLLLLTGVGAPILEEVVFRGFLLASLTKHMPITGAVVLSSLTFAACHATPKDFPQLFALGCVMGFAYCRSRNLLTSMIIHGAWNSSVIAILYVLVSSGMPIRQILEG